MLRWEDPAWREEAEAWIRSHVEVTGAIEDERIKPWAAVLRVPTSAGSMYFKEAVPYHAQEARLLEILARRRPELVTEVEVTGELGRMLMRDAGLQLTALLEQDLDLRYWEEALPLYAELQIETATDADELVAAGALDRRGAALPAIFDELVATQAQGLADAEYLELCALAPEVRSFVEEVAAHPVPETIQNDDLTDGSIFIRDGAYRFLDWGDACVSHPFFTLTVTQRVIEIRHKLPAGSREIGRIRDAYLEPFTRFEPRAALLALAEPGRRIGQICRSAMRLDVERDRPYSDEPDELAWSLRLLLDPEAWRGWDL